MKTTHRNTILTLGLILLILGGACEKEMDISAFRRDFDYYQPQLRVEGIFDPVNPARSIVRLDRSLRIDDTEVFNGLDDDGDWDPATDDLGQDGIQGKTSGFPRKDKGEGNGRPDQGEPHVDELDEILPFIQDTTAIVTLTHLQSGDVFRFTWQPAADSFEVPIRFSFDEERPQTEWVRYGAYRPQPDDPFHLICNCEYEFKIISARFGLTITGYTTPLPPVTFVDPFFQPLPTDTLVVVYHSDRIVFWVSDPRTSVYYIRMEQFIAADSIEIVYKHPSFPIRALTDLNGGQPVGAEPLLADITPGLYRLTVYVMDPDYGRYFYSSLPLNNPQKSNLRDQHGRPVMGAIGSITPRQLILIVLPPDAET